MTAVAIPTTNPEANERATDNTTDESEFSHFYCVVCNNCTPFEHGVYVMLCGFEEYCCAKGADKRPECPMCQVLRPIHPHK